MKVNRNRMGVMLSALLLIAIGTRPVGAEPYVPPLFGVISPRITPQDRLALSAVGGHERGAIPASFADVSAGVSVGRRAGIEAGAVAVHLPDLNEYRLAEVSGTLTIPLLSLDRLSLSPYARAALHIGEEIVEAYSGNLDDISAAVSPRADGGYDLSAGLAAAIALPDVATNPTALAVHIAYDHTGARDATRTGLEEETRRVSVAATPTVFFTDPDRYPRAAFGWTHTAVYWFDRGYFYDMTPQLTLEIAEPVAVNAGVTVPVVGGLVWRAFAGVHLSLTRRREIRIVVENLHFPPDSADLYGFADETRNARNREVIADLYRQLRRYRHHAITVEGHTSFVHWNDPVRGPREEREVLGPLSQARAEAVRSALVTHGIDAGRIVAEGKGASEPAVPFSDTENQWQNRRVEIVLRRR